MLAAFSYFKCEFYLKGKILASGNKKEDVKTGSIVKIVLKRDQGTGKLTEGVVKNILTK